MFTESRKHLLPLFLCVMGEVGGWEWIPHEETAQPRGEARVPAEPQEVAGIRNTWVPRKQGQERDWKGTVYSCCVESCLPPWSLSDASPDTCAPLSLSRLLAPAAEESSDSLQVSAVFQCFTLWQNSHPSTYCLGASLLDAGMQDAAWYTHTQLKSQEG